MLHVSYYAQNYAGIIRQGLIRSVLAPKTFVKKIEKGAVVKVVREHYLRDNVWCGVRGCGMCRQQEPPLENCPLVDSDLCSDPHYVLPDTCTTLSFTRLTF